MAEECVPVDTLRELLEYDPTSGSLVWRPRRPEHFGGAQQDPAHSCKIWNTRFAGKQALNARNGSGYRQGAIFGRTISAHTVAWALHTGHYPQHGIDHINGDEGDNRIANLRDVPAQTNSKNQARNVRNTSGVTGVHFDQRTGKWVASIKAGGRVRNLGYFATLDEAAAARRVASEHFGFHPNHGRVAA